MGNMHGHSDAYPKWDLMIFTEDRLPEILGIVTDLEQFLDHYGLDAKPSRLKPNQQLAVIKNGLYESLTSSNEYDRDLWVRGLGLFLTFYCTLVLFYNLLRRK